MRALPAPEVERGLWGRAHPRRRPWGGDPARGSGEGKSAAFTRTQQLVNPSALQSGGMKNGRWRKPWNASSRLASSPTCLARSLRNQIEILLKNVPASPRGQWVSAASAAPSRRSSVVCPLQRVALAGPNVGEEDRRKGRFSRPPAAQCTEHVRRGRLRGCCGLSCRYSDRWQGPSREGLPQEGGGHLRTQGARIA